MSIRHGVGGEEYVIDKLTRRSTVEDVISRIVKDLKLDKGRWIILEVSFSAISVKSVRIYILLKWVFKPAL